MIRILNTSKIFLSIVITFLATGCVSSDNGKFSKNPISTSDIIPTPTPSNTPPLSAISTPTPTATPTPSATPAPTPTPTATPTPTPAASGAAYQFSITNTPSSSVVAGQQMSVKPIVEMQDDQGIRVTNYSRNDLRIDQFEDDLCLFPITQNPMGDSNGGRLFSMSNGLMDFNGVSFSFTTARPSYLGIYDPQDPQIIPACIELTVNPGAFDSSRSTVKTIRTDLSASSDASNPIQVSSATNDQGTVQLTVRDAYGNLNPTGILAVSFSSQSVIPTTGSITLTGSVSGPSGSIYSQTFTGTAVGKVKISARVDGVTVIQNDESNNVEIQAGSAAKLSFASALGGIQPSNSSTAGSNLSTQPRVVVLDSNDNIVTSYQSAISLQAYSDSGCSTTAIPNTPNGTGHTLGSASISATPSAGTGYAQFSGVQANRTGAASTTGSVYLRASSGAIPTACSNQIVVTSGSVAGLTWSTLPAPTSMTAGVALTQQPVIRAIDSFGNLANDHTGTVTITAHANNTCTSAISSSATGNSVSLSGSTATFATLSINKISAVCLQASDGTRAINYEPISVQAGSYSDLVVVSGDNQIAPASTELSSPLEVQAQDAFQNPVVGVNVNWSTNSGVLSFNSTVTNASGLASVTLTLGPETGASNHQILASAGIKTVTFQATSLAPNPTVSNVLITGTYNGSGNATKTSTRNVSVTFDSENASEVCLRTVNDVSGCSWQSIPIPGSFTLASGLGTQNVYVWVRSGVNNVSSVASDSIDVVCPTNWVAVKANATLGTSDFCAARVEMRDVSGSAGFTPSLIPWDPGSFSAASSACTAQGWTLMTNAQYQALARDLETVPSNWTNGSVGSGQIYVGNDGSVSAYSISGGSSEAYLSNVANGYDSTGNSSGIRRRTLTTSLGEVIWDLSGNVKEIVASSFSGLSANGLPPDTWGSPVQYNNAYFSASPNRNLFGPSNSSYTTNQGVGLFTFWNNNTGNPVFRGGDYGWTGDVGIFGAKIIGWEGTGRQGFRCVTTP